MVGNGTVREMEEWSRAFAGRASVRDYSEVAVVDRVVGRQDKADRIA